MKRGVTLQRTEGAILVGIMKGNVTIEDEGLGEHLGGYKNKKNGRSSDEIINWMKVGSIWFQWEIEYWCFSGLANVPVRLFRMIYSVWR